MNSINIHKRNYYALIAEGSFFFIGLSFIDVNAVIPVFIYTYTQSMMLVGLATTINLAASVISQILIGPYVKSIKNPRGYIIRIMFIFRLAPALSIPVLLAGFQPLTTVMTFLTIYALFFMGDGLIVVPWTDLFGRTILPDKRGKLLGYQMLVGGVGCLGSGFFIKFLIDHKQLTNTTRYSIIFGSAALIFFISAICMLYVHDIPRAASIKPLSSWRYYTQMWSYLKKDKNFSRVAVIKILTSFAGMTAPFLILFGQDVFSLDATRISTLMYIQIVGGLVSGYIWGMISNRFGNKYVIMLPQVFSLLILTGALGCYLLRGQAAFWVIMWPIILLNGTNMGSWFGVLNYTIDIVSEEDRTVYLLLGNVITFPLTILTFLAGIIADITGFAPLFFISLSAAIAAALLSRRLKSPHQIDEMRKEQSYD